MSTNSQKRLEYLSPLRRAPPPEHSFHVAPQGWALRSERP
jgi:hypothetical protein